ncbi:MAG TPA: hypothetical protein VKA67_10000 [Verrucomicrobiae bacterium]|nr:hypothetical protein [Verrucomicrobiae bacterium]
MADLTSHISLGEHNTLTDVGLIMLSLRPRSTEIAALGNLRPRQQALSFLYDPPRDGDGFMKWCCRCGDWRPRAYYSPKADARDGLHPYCKECRNREERKRYHARKQMA